MARAEELRLDNHEGVSQHCCVMQESNSDEVPYCGYCTSFCCCNAIPDLTVIRTYINLRDFTLDHAPMFISNPQCFNVASS